MIRLSALFAAALLAVALPSAASAQDAPAPAAAPFVGLTPDAVRQWLVAAGATAGPVTRDESDVFFRVEDGGTVWFVFFYDCEADGRCGDMQFNTVFDGKDVLPEVVAAWNRERRFLKAFQTDAAGQPLIFVQYDVLFISGQRVDQLADAAVIWLEGLDLFVRHLQAAAAPPAA